MKTQKGGAAHAAFIESANALMVRALRDRLALRIELTSTGEGVAELFDEHGHASLTHQLAGPRGAQLNLPLAAPAAPPPAPSCVHTWERIEGEHEECWYECVWCDSTLLRGQGGFFEVDARHRRNALFEAPAAPPPAADPLAPGHRVMRVGDLVIERLPKNATRDWIVREITDKGPILQRDDRPDLFETVTWAHIDLDAADLWRLSSEHDEPSAEPSRGDGRPIEAPVKTMASVGPASDITGIGIGDVLTLDGVRVEVLGVDPEGFIWRTVEGERDRDEGDTAWSEVESTEANVWNTRTEAVEPSLCVLIVHDEGADAIGAIKGLDAWHPAKTPGAGSMSGGNCRPLVMLFTPHVESDDDTPDDVDRLLARYAKVGRPVLDLGLIRREDLNAHEPWRPEMREQWNKAHPTHRVSVPETAPKPRAKTTTKAPKLHRKTKELGPDVLAIRGEHCVIGLVDDEWTTLAIRESGVTAAAWKLRAKACAENGVRVRVYDGGSRCVWDSLDGGEP
jgi:hypothetical protein